MIVFGDHKFLEQFQVKHELVRLTWGTWVRLLRRSCRKMQSNFVWDACNLLYSPVMILFHAETCWLQKHRFPLVLCHSRMKKAHIWSQIRSCVTNTRTVCQLEQVKYCLLDLPQIEHREWIQWEINWYSSNICVEPKNSKPWNYNVSCGINCCHIC